MSQPPDGIELDLAAVASQLRSADPAVRADAADDAERWYRSTLDALDGLRPGDDPERAYRVVEAARTANGVVPIAHPAPLAPILRGQLDRLSEVLLGLAAQPERDLFPIEPGLRLGPNSLADLIQETATIGHAHTSPISGDEDIRAAVALLVPRVLIGHPVTKLRGYLRLLRDHPEPALGLAAVIDILVRESTMEGRSPLRDIGSALLDQRDFDLPALAHALEPYAGRWAEDRLDALVRHALLDHIYQDTGHQELARRLRRAPTRRAVPDLLVGLGQTTPALRQLAEVLATANRPAPVPAPVLDGVPFADVNLKLVVLDQLMYDLAVLDPVFDLRSFVRGYEGREILIEDEGYRLIPEALDHFARFPLTAAELAQVTELAFDGGAQIYGEIYPFWDGEDDTFDVRSFADVAQLPNLRRVVIISMVAADTDLTPLSDRGIVIDRP